MKKNHHRVLTILVVLVFIALSMSSCNRGIGCPSEFSVSTDLIQSAVELAVQSIRF